MFERMSRRALLVAAGAAALLAGCSLFRAAVPRAPDPTPPIVFVHGNGDTAALWLTTLWRFESNGWPRERLHPIDLPYPLARDDDSKAQEGRTSAAEHMQFLSAEVDKVLKATGAAQVVLIGNSRGGIAIRNYIANGGGARKVSHAILGGTPNHGVWADTKRLPGNEFNGAGPVLTALNAPKGAEGLEVTPGVRWMTIRSDNNDKFAQPDGVWIGARGTPTNVNADGPALKGADNVVIPGIDHRETSFGPQAFTAAFRFITGRTPNTASITPESSVVLNGKVSGIGLNNDPAFQRIGRNALRVRGQRARLCHDAHLPRALPALVEHRQPAGRAHRRRRSRREGGGHADAPARLLRHSARPDRTGRQDAARRHSARRGRRVHREAEGARLGQPHGGRRVQRRAHRRPRLAGCRQPRGVPRTPLLTGRAAR
jgi:pimeloyl-ACP methyl ester carboxylesterase